MKVYCNRCSIEYCPSPVMGQFDCLICGSPLEKEPRANRRYQKVATLGKPVPIKEQLIREVKEGRGLGARMAVRELNYVNWLWKGQPKKEAGK